MVIPFLIYPVWINGGSLLILRLLLGNWQREHGETAATATSNNGGEIDLHESRITTKDGSVREVEIKVTLLDEYIVVTVNDISHRNQMERERLKLKKLESLGVLAGGIAHDFNNLLTSLFGNIEMASAFIPANHKSLKYLQTAHKSMETATNLTKQLLTFAKGGDPVREIVAIGDVIRETAEFSLRGGNIRLNCEVLPALWPVSVDKGQLSQVISNLVINAQQAMPDGGAISIVAKNARLSGTRFVIIHVKDQGRGIQPVVIDKIFDPYFTTSSTGSGLGLATTYSIVRKHGGTITVRSQPNEGAIFTISLPAAAAVQSTLSPQVGVEGLPDKFPGLRVLVMDDDAQIRELIGAMLNQLEMDSSFATNGVEVVTKYRSAMVQGNPYDLVIADLTVPGGVGGKEAAEDILKIDPAAIIIVSSGYATDPVLSKYHEYGFADRVAKPYGLKELKAVIARNLPQAIAVAN